MEQEERKPSLLNHAAKWGVISGAISIVMVVLVYAIDYTFMASFKFLGLAVLVTLAILIYSGIEYRKSIGGYLSYGKAWQHGFIILAISGVISLLFNAVLYKIIDTELTEKVADAVADNTRAMMENFGAPEDQIEPGVNKAREDFIERFTTTGMLKGFLFQLIGSAIFVLITAIFTRKSPPADQM